MFYNIWLSFNVNRKFGKATIKENGTYNSYDIPGVIPAFDIMGSYKLSDKDIIVYNQECFWIYSLDNKTYYKEKRIPQGITPQHLTTIQFDIC